MSGTTSEASSALPLRPNTTLGGFISGTDLKAEELVVLTGGLTSRDSWNTRDHEDGQCRSSESGGANLLELHGGVWEHIGLPRHRLVDTLLWAQRHVANADRTTSGSSSRESPVGGWRANTRWRESEVSSQDIRQRKEEVAAEKTVARVTMRVLQGLLVGELPRGFAASFAYPDRREQPLNSSTDLAQVIGTPLFSTPNGVSLDPFFAEASADGDGKPGEGIKRGASWRQRERDRGGSAGAKRGAPPQRPGSPSHPRRSGRARSSGSTSSASLPLLIRLPEAFPALCQQVATAPQGAVSRGAVIETLVAAVQNQRNSKSILSVDSWQQYLLSVVSSAQGRQINAAVIASERTQSRDTTSTNQRSVGAGAAEEERLVDQTVKLICWLAMCEAREGKTGRPGAGFVALQDTMSFLRCQEELGTMECVSVGEIMLRHMVRMLAETLGT